MTSEEWRDVPNWEEYFQVSSEGRVRSKVRFVNGKYVGGNIISQRLNGRGYPTVSLQVSGLPIKRLRIHRAMGVAFLGATSDQVVRHLDDVKTNNSLSNLAVGTLSENSFDAVRNGRNHQALKTRCINGHDYTPENTSYNYQGHRRCKACVRVHSLARSRHIDKAQSII